MALRLTMVGQHAGGGLRWDSCKECWGRSGAGYGPVVPEEFLTDEQAEAYGKFAEEPTRPELERFFFLDDVDRDLIARRRSAHHQLGFALQMCTVRYIGRFLPDDPRRSLNRGCVNGRPTGADLDRMYPGCGASPVAPHPDNQGPFRTFSQSTERPFSRSGPVAQQAAEKVNVRDGAGTYRVFTLLNCGDPHAVRSDRSR
nr:DUF4158 domain-containing protein [Streptomyces sp. WAC04770]